MHVRDFRFINIYINYFGSVIIYVLSIVSFSIIRDILIFMTLFITNQKVENNYIADKCAAALISIAKTASQ